MRTARPKRLFAGTADACAEWLHAYAAAGAWHIILRLAGEDHHVALEQVAAEILPAIRPTALAAERS